MQTKYYETPVPPESFFAGIYIVDPEDIPPISRHSIVPLFLVEAQDHVSLASQAYMKARKIASCLYAYPNADQTTFWGRAAFGWTDQDGTEHIFLVERGDDGYQSLIYVHREHVRQGPNGTTKAYVLGSNNVLALQLFPAEEMPEAITRGAPELGQIMYGGFFSVDSGVDIANPACRRFLLDVNNAFDRILDSLNMTSGS